jgi:hypothetical protein
LTNFFIGVDLGQAQDYTAITVMDVIPTVYQKHIAGIDMETGLPRTRTVPVDGPPLTYHVRHLQRIPLGTTYPVQVQTVKKIMDKLEGNKTLVIDQTGVGRAVFDMFNATGMRPIGISIHGGDKVVQDGYTFRVPKRDLVGVLMSAFQNEKLKIAEALSEARTLRDELLNFKVKINLKTAHDSYEAWREGIHDDLVLSVGLAAWTAHYYYANLDIRDEVILVDNYRI